MLRAWFAEARADGKSENQAVRAVARRLGEDEKTARRVLVRAGQRFGGKSSRGPHGTAPHASQKPLDTAAVQAAYRGHRTGGLDPEQAVKAVAREFGARPHDVRRVVGVVEFAMRDETQRPTQQSQSKRKD